MLLHKHGLIRCPSPPKIPLRRYSATACCSGGYAGQQCSTTPHLQEDSLTLINRNILLIRFGIFPHPFSVSLKHKDDAKLCLLLHFPPCIFFRHPLPLPFHYWSRTSRSKQHPLWKLLPRPPLIGQQQSCSDIENQVCLKSSKTSKMQSGDRIFLTSTACKSLCGDSFQFYDLSNILQLFPQWVVPAIVPTSALPLPAAASMEPWGCFISPPRRPCGLLIVHAVPYPDRPDVLPKSQRQSFGLRSGYEEIGFQDASEWFCNILKEIQNRDKRNNFLKTRKLEEHSLKWNTALHISLDKRHSNLPLIDQRLCFLHGGYIRAC